MFSSDSIRKPDALPNGNTTPIVQRRNRHLNSYGRHAATLIVAMLLLAAPAAAQTICWGKICYTSPLKNSGLCEVCCGGHGKCISYNNCQCDDGWTGIECTVWTRCGPACPSDCNGGGNGICYPAATSSAPYNSTTGSCYCADGIGGACCDSFRKGTLNPSALAFGSTTTGTTAAAPSPVTYVNPKATTSMTLGSIAIGGAHAGDFALGAGTCTDGGSVTGGGTCTIVVTFSPSGTGNRTAILTVTTTDPDHAGNTQSLTANLTGTGTRGVSSIIIDPSVPSHIVAGLDGAGIYRTTDSGGSWSAVTLTPLSTRIRALVMKPGDGSLLYAGTYGDGVYRSTDSGITWNACTNTGLANQYVLSLVTNTSGGLYAGTENGIYTSGDCNTWTGINTGLP